MPLPACPPVCADNRRIKIWCTQQVLAQPIWPSSHHCTEYRLRSLHAPFSRQRFRPESARERCSTSQQTVGAALSIFQADRQERTNSLPDSPTAAHLCPAALGYFLFAPFKKDERGILGAKKLPFWLGRCGLMFPPCWHVLITKFSASPAEQKEEERSGTFRGAFLAPE